MAKSVIEIGQIIDNVQRAVHFNHQNRIGQIAQHREKKSLEEKFQKTFVEFIWKEKLTQTSGSVSAENRQNETSQIDWFRI